VHTGFVEHIRGWAAMTDARIRSTAPKAIRRRGAVLRSKGIEILGPIVPTSALAPIVARFEAHLASDAAVRVLKDGAPIYEGGLRFGADDMPLLLPVMVPEIVDALRAMTGSGFRVVSYAVWRNHHVPSSTNDEIYSERWHSDGVRTDLQKVFIFLSDVTPEDGGTVVADRANSRAACRAGYRGRRTYGNAAPIFDALERKGGIYGPAGTAYLVNTSHCLHRAGVPAPGRSRDILQIQAFASPTVDLVPMTPDRLSWIDRVHLGW
jgi:hypothetical protein